jgi:uncharacterized membrane protein
MAPKTQNKTSVSKPVANKPVERNIVEDGKACAILSYVIIGIFWFFLDKDMRKNSFAKFHVKQAIILILGLVIIEIARQLFSIISRQFSEIITSVLLLGMAIIWIIAFIYVIEGKEKEMPVLGQFAKKLDF